MMHRQTAHERLTAAGLFGLAGLMLFWSWPLWPEIINMLAALAGCSFLVVGGFVALLAIRGKPLEALLATGGIFAALWASAQFGPMGTHDILLNSRIKRIQGEVQALKSRVGESRIVSAMVADQEIGKDLDRKVSQSTPPAFSFRVALYGIDDGVNLVFDPSGKFDRFAGIDGMFDREWKEWVDYQSLIYGSPTGIKMLGEGWYLVYFT